MISGFLDTNGVLYPCPSYAHMSLAEELVKSVTEKYPNLDVILSCGGQPVYYYGIAIEE